MNQAYKHLSLIKAPQKKIYYCNCEYKPLSKGPYKKPKFLLQNIQRFQRS